MDRMMGSPGRRKEVPIIVYQTPSVLHFSGILAIAAFLVMVSGCGVSTEHGEYDLSGPRSRESRSYVMRTEIIHFAPDGTRTGVDSLSLFLTAAMKSGEEVYTCRKLVIRKAGEDASEIPALAGWTYTYAPSESDSGDGGDLLGIDRSKFVNLTEAGGAPLPPDMQYAVYNTFIDFHTFCNVFARPTSGGKGIQDLHSIGQKIMHVAAFSEPPLDVGETVRRGSTFKNGRITLELKGVSEVAGRQCALIGYDSGNSSYTMIMQPMPNMDITTVGSSHYFGDIYVDLNSKWVDKAVMGEFVVSETTISGMAEKRHSTIERAILILSVDNDVFEQEIQ